MAVSYITHHLYPDNPHMFIVDFKQVVKLRGEPSTSFSRNRRGEHFWEAVIYTSGLDSTGERLGPYWVDVVGTETTLNEMINNKIKYICSEIDWSKHPLDTEYIIPIGVDRYSPKISSQYPTNGQTDVPIDSRIIITLVDDLPAKGIDVSSITMTVDGFSVTPEVSGNPYKCVVTYKPLVGE